MIDSKIEKSREIILALFLIFFYLFFQLIYINLPGLYCDEAFGAMGTLQMIGKANYPAVPSLHLFNKYFPLMRVQYHSSIESYFLLPFFLLFGINVMSLRLMPVFFSALTLVFTFLLAKKFFSYKIAVFSIILLITNPSFILGSRLGNDHGSMMSMFLVGGLFFLWIWLEKKRDRFFYMVMFLLGLGISVRIWFTWFITAFIFASLIYTKEMKMIFAEKSKIRSVILLINAAISFCIGSILLIIYNVKNNFLSLSYSISHFNTTKLGENNLDYVNNLLHRMKDFVFLANGKWFLMHLGGTLKNIYPKLIPGNNACIWLYVFSIAWLLVSCAVRKKMLIDKKRCLFLLLLILLMFLQTPFTLSGFGPMHLFIFFPFMQILLCLALFDSLFLLKKYKKIVLVFTFVIFTFLILTNIYCLTKYHIYYKTTGGEGNRSDAIVRLANWLEENRIYEPLAMDWGFQHSIFFLSEGSITCRIFSYTELLTNIEPDRSLFKEASLRDYKKLIEKRNRNYLLFHSPRFTNRDFYKDILETTHLSGKNLIKKKEFYQKNGELVYLVYMVE